MKRFLLIILLVGCVCISAAGESKRLSELRSDFGAASTEFRPNPLWFWNNTTITSDGVAALMQAIRDSCGYGGVSVVPFGKDFAPEYLSEEYFAVYRTMLEKAKELGLKVWLYDEYGFPSGSLGYHNGNKRSIFVETHPQAAMKSLFREEHRVAAGQTLDIPISGLGNLMSVVAVDTLTHKTINLRPYVKNSRLSWKAPQGAWRVTVAMCRIDGEPLVDYLDPEACRLFVDMTHQQYYNRFKDYFGNVIVGTFFDEPTLYRKQGTNWTPLFNEKFEQKYGFSPEELYPALWHDMGEKTAYARNMLFGFRSELYAAAFTKELNDWSVAHGVMPTGHQDNEERENPVGTSGDLMKCFKYLKIPGIDKIGGNRPAEDYYKVISSAAYNWDNSLVMSETYGAMGDIEWSEIFSIAMDQYSKGINILIPHAVWYDDTQVTFKPELSYRHPKYADSLRTFNDYLTRMNVLLQNEGRVVADVAMVYPIETLQAGHYFEGPLRTYLGGVEIPLLDYVKVSTTLTDNLGIDHTYLHPEVIVERCSPANGTLKLNNPTQWGEYSTLIFPSCGVVDLAVLEKGYAMLRSGGKVIFTTRLPSEAALGNDDKVRAMVSEMIDAGAILVENPTSENLEKALNGKVRAIEFKGTPLRNIHKKVDGKSVCFFANPSAQSVSTTASVNGLKSAELWNPHNGTITRCDVTAKNSRGEVSIELPPYSSIFIVEK